MKQITLKEIQNAFPQNRKNGASTGNIPITFFTENEKAIRAMMKLECLRAIYRGPRIHNKLGGFGAKASMTRRCDATSVLLYWKL